MKLVNVPKRHTAIADNISTIGCELTAMDEQVKDHEHAKLRLSCATDVLATFPRIATGLLTKISSITLVNQPRFDRLFIFNLVDFIYLIFCFCFIRLWLRNLQTEGL